MGQHPTKQSTRQGRGPGAPPTVPIPRPLLETLEDAETAFFGLCIETGKQVLAASSGFRASRPRRRATRSTATRSRRSPRE